MNQIREHGLASTVRRERQQIGARQHAGEQTRRGHDCNPECIGRGQAQSAITGCWLGLGQPITLCGGSRRMTLRTDGP
jgi:hypothetical protein